MYAPNFSSIGAFMAILWPFKNPFWAESRMVRFLAEIGQFQKMFINLLEFDKTHRNTCLIQISAHLKHFWAFYGNFRTHYGPS